MQIRRFSQTDVDHILAIQKSHLLKVQEREQSRKGFLVHPIRRQTFERLLTSQKGHVYVAPGKQGPDCYMVFHTDKKYFNQAMRSKTFKPISPDALELLNGRYVYLRHVAKKQGVSSERMAEFENQVYASLKKQGFGCGLAEITLDPPNHASLKAHKQFKLIAQYKEEKTGVTWGIFAKQFL